MKIKLSQYLLCGYAILVSNAFTTSLYANEPHDSKDHVYEESIYKNDQILTLKEATDLALEFSPALRSSKDGVRAARGSEKQAGYWASPELEIEAENIAGSGQYSGSNSAEYTYSLSQAIDISGKIPARKKVALENRKAAGSAVTINKLKVIRDLHVAYAQTLSEAEMLKLAKEQKEIAKQVLKIVSKRVNAAREPEIQGVKATLAYEKSIIASDQRRQQLRFSKQNLSKLIGVEISNSSLDHSHFFDLNAPESLESYKNLLDKSPILQRSDYLINAKKSSFDLEIAKKVSSPKLKFGVREFRGSNQQAFVAGISIPLPIFGFNSGNISRAGAELSQARNDQLQTKISLEQSLIEEWKNWQVSYSTAKKLRDVILPAAQKAFKLSQEGYKNGKFPYLGVLDAQRTLFETKSKYYLLLRKYHIAKANIDLLTTPINNNY